ncbi:Delta(8)-fatty-acid desaturase [Dendrobium catenatum]|uniref:Delta(8)-fatty-acid desaturase n=1 Tax=Dendrobium catenatum TaxID=906689 RepID=A0A2I0VNZ0_9ASPA|nr:Delta(8)-fatty-acid desaturase [Dendrobium catenatum]
MATKTAEKKHIILVELGEHNSPSNLWISIHDKVYNLTHWVRDHPGGDIPLLNLTGQDATDPFTALNPPSAWKHLDRFFVSYHLSDNHISDLSKDYQHLIFDFTKLGLFEQKGHVILLTLSIIFSLSPSSSSSSSTPPASMPTLLYAFRLVLYGPNRVDSLCTVQSSSSLKQECASQIPRDTWGNGVLGGTPFVSSAAKVPSSKDCSFGEGALQETQVAVPERWFL